MATLTTGARLGPYAVLEQIGQGGMGEVYRATDTRLDRIVAIKVLPAHVADSPMRRQRFEREARAVSSLNDPHICALYDVGEQDASPFLVMEYVEGETLARRLMRGALPIDQTLRYAIEIADALDHAHRQGIVHRDLKPANIMLTRTGIKLLDFGIAKMWSPDSIAGHSVTATRPADTITDEGTIVGTLHYMAPEQLEGRDTDARTDIFAFGAVLYEMITGQPAFHGQSQASVIAAILEREPAPLSAARASVPSLLDQIITRCLAKNPDDRWQTAADLKQALTWVAEGAPSGTTTAGVAPRPTFMRTRLAWIASGGVAIACVATAVLWITSSRRESPDARAFRFTVSAPQNQTFSQSAASLALSPDGHSLAFTASSRQGNLTLWIQSLDSLVARPLPGTDRGAGQPFWSPDSQSLAFSAPNGKGKFFLKKIDVGGGSPQMLTDTMELQTGTWNRGGVIIFKPNLAGPLYRMGAAGGSATPVTTLDAPRAETSHNWPHFLPDGRRFLYLARSSQLEHDGVLYVASLDSNDRVPLFHVDSHVVYAAPGYLIYMRGNTLVAQPFDAANVRVTGEPVPIAEQVERNTGSRRGAFSVSQNGVLAYRSIGETELVWFDRGGRRLEKIGPAGRYSNPALSPDERQVAVAHLDSETGASDIWLIELARGITSRFTADLAPDDMPLWSPDGSRIVFKSHRDPTAERSWSFHQKASSGTGPEEILLTGLGPASMPLGWSPDARFLIYGTATGAVSANLWLLPRFGDRRPVPFLQSAFTETQARLSDDGRWIAYVSDESGRNEVYVRAFPSGDGKSQISINGGIEPAWRKDGKELFYLAPDRNLMAVTIKTASSVEASSPTRLFETAMSNLSYLTRNQYLVAADGQRFLINQPVAGGSPSPITVVVGWPALLKKFVER